MHFGGNVTDSSLRKILPSYLYAYFISRKRLEKWLKEIGYWRSKIVALAFWGDGTDVTGDLYEPDGFSAKADSRTSELVAGGWLLRRGYIHPHVIVGEV